MKLGFDTSFRSRAISYPPSQLLEFATSHDGIYQIIYLLLEWRQQYSSSISSSFLYVLGIGQACLRAHGGIASLQPTACDRAS